MHGMIDLHVHSTSSDGSFTPAELVKKAQEKGLAAFALTDHDTVDGIGEAVAAAVNTGIQVIPGIEFSTGYKGRDIHILGLGIQYKNAKFQEELKKFRDSRKIRNQKMIQKLREHQVEISEEIMKERFPESVCTRAHLAKFLEEEGYVSSKQEAFERYLGERACCYVPREKADPARAIALIHESGGIAGLAHPLLYGFSKENLEELVRELWEEGLDAIEAIYSCNRPSETERMLKLAQKYNLKVTGGSDFHGTLKPGLEMGNGYGDLKIPYSILEHLFENRGLRE